MTQRESSLCPRSDRRTRWALVAILTLAAALRLHHLGYQSLWADEALTVFIANEPLDQIAGAVRKAEQTPPLLHYLMHGWTSVAGLSEGMLRLPAAAFSTLAVWATYALGARLFDRRTGLFAALLMATSGFQIIYAQEARVYSLFLLAALLSCLSFVAILQRGGRRSEVLYVLSTALLYWSHLHAVFVVAVQQMTWVYCLRTGGGAAPAWRRWTLLSVLPLLLFAPWMPTVVGWVRGVSGGFWIAPLGADYLPRGYAMYAGSYLMLALLAPLVALGITRAPSRWQVVFLVCLLTVPVIVPYLVSLATRPLAMPRYAIAASAGLTLLAARGVSRLPSPRWLPCLTLAGLACASIWSLPGLRRQIAYKPDARGAAQYVVAHAAAPGDLVYVGSDFGNLTLRHYFRDAATTGLFVTSFAEDVPPPTRVPKGTTLWMLLPSSLAWQGRNMLDGPTRLAQLGWTDEAKIQFDGYVVVRSQPVR